MPAYGTSRTARTAVLPYNGVMRHPLTEGHTGLPEMDCPLITSEHSFRISREESHDFNRGRSQKKIWDDIFTTNDTSDKQTEYYNVFNYRDSRWYHRTERQSKQLSIIQCLDMIDSIIAYSPQGNKSLARDILNKDLSSKYSYLKQYVNMFSYHFVWACINSQLKSIDKINTNVFTDDEGLSYNSVIYKK